jgi:hypothetical protein
VHMSLFTYILDLSVMQSYVVYQKVTKEAARRHSYFNYRRLICEQLVMPHHNSHQQQRAVVHATVQDVGVESSQRKRRRPNSSTLMDADCVGVIDNQHMLMENHPRAKNSNKPADVDCY